MNEKESCAWSAFVESVKNILGNRYVVNYKGIVATLLSTLQDMGANVSIKLHFLNRHLEHFPKNLGDLSDEQGEQFHEDISEMEVRYQGRWDAAMLPDYCWSIKRVSVVFFYYSKRIRNSSAKAGPLLIASCFHLNRSAPIVFDGLKQALAKASWGAIRHVFRFLLKLTLPILPWL